MVFIFSRFLLENKTEININSSTKGVSVIVCAWNELENLQVLLPNLLSQNYPDFEVIVVDDRSKDGTAEYLKEKFEFFPNFKIVTIGETPEHLASKKYALSLGIKVATKDLILLTDADCTPTSNLWITGMANKLTNEKQIVLGFSPYQKESGLLNLFIRFETMFTAWQYFSYALVGMPYMGVGRNLMYRRRLFFDNLGFRNHQKINGGDDDLFINETSNSRNTSICFHENAQSISIPKKTFSEWYIQKKRHLAIGKRYKTRDKILLGIYSITHILSWLLLPLMFFMAPKFQAICAIAFGLRLMLFWLFGGITNSKLGKVIPWIAIPFLDFLLALYYGAMGWFSLVSSKKIRWR